MYVNYTCTLILHVTRGINNCKGARAELSTGRLDPPVGSGRVGSRFCRILAGRVGTLDFLFFSLIIS